MLMSIFMVAGDRLYLKKRKLCQEMYRRKGDVPLFAEIYTASAMAAAARREEGVSFISKVSANRRS